MLVTSILRQQQDWSDEVGRDDTPQDGNLCRTAGVIDA
jgi:hypothetical protein